MERCWDWAGSSQLASSSVVAARQATLGALAWPEGRVSPSRSLGRWPFLVGLTQHRRPALPRVASVTCAQQRGSQRQAPWAGHPVAVREKCPGSDTLGPNSKQNKVLLLTFSGNEVGCAQGCGVWKGKNEREGR